MTASGPFLRPSCTTRPVPAAHDHSPMKPATQTNRSSIVSRLGELLHPQGQSLGVLRCRPVQAMAVGRWGLRCSECEWDMSNQF